MILRIPLLPWRTFRNRLLLFNLILTSILAKLVKPSIYLLLVAIAQRLLLTLMTPWRLLTPPSAWTAPTLLHASTSSTCVNSPSVRPSTPTSPSPPWYDLLVFCAPLCHHFVFRHLRPLGLGWGKATTFPTFDSKTLQSPVGCFDGFDQILKRWNLIVCGPDLRSGPDMHRDYGPASPTRIREMRLHPVCCSHGWSRIRLFFRDHHLMWLCT